MTANLAYIRQVTREVSGNMSPGLLSNAELDQEINNFLRLEFLNEVKVDPQEQFYEFNTVIGQRDYSHPTEYINFEPYVTVDRQECYYYQDPNVFEAKTTESVNASNAFTGDGSTVAFSDTFGPQNVILAGSVIVNDSTETFTDDGLGVLSSDGGGTGTVNYTTGAIAVSFGAAPSDGEAIWVSYIQLPRSRPTDMLFYENQFRFYPVPDNVYRVRMKGWKLPIALTSASQTPESQEWSLFIAYGAALRLLGRYGEMDKIAAVRALYEEQRTLVMRRTINQTINERGRPSF